LSWYEAANSLFSGFLSSQSCSTATSNACAKFPTVKQHPCQLDARSVFLVHISKENATGYEKSKSMKLASFLKLTPRDTLFLKIESALA
jgi:hypothetical protein